MNFQSLLRPNVVALLTEKPDSKQVSTLDTLQANLAETRAALCKQLSLIRNVSPDCIHFTTGTAHSLCQLLTLFCQPRIDNVVTPSPLAPHIAHQCMLADVELRTAPLTPNFDFEATSLLCASNGRTKIAYLCSPHIPTGNPLNRAQLQQMFADFGGLVVVNEAHADYSSLPSLVPLVASEPRLVVLRTFSQSWADPSLRLAVVYASPSLVDLLSRAFVAPSVGVPVLLRANQILSRPQDAHRRLRQTIDERAKVAQSLSQLPYVEKVYPSHANFLLVRFANADTVARHLQAHGIPCQLFAASSPCAQCLQISIGTPQENTKLLAALRNLL